jgi:hypothetical protein
MWGNALCNIYQVSDGVIWVLGYSMMALCSEGVEALETNEPWKS